MVRNCTNMAARAGTGIFASVVLAAVGAFAPSAFGGGCGTISGTSDGQIGIQGFDLQECGDDQWTGLAFAINTGGGLVDTLTFQLNTNRAGGDVYITGDAGGCQPDVTNILATMCCSLEGLPEGVPLTLHFTAVATSADSPTWVVFVGRTGSAGQDEDGNFDGSNFPSHQVARECTDDGNGNCIEESAPGQGFANLVGTGNPGDWTDLHDLGDPPLGTQYTVALSETNADADIFDCADFVGACCPFTGVCIEGSHPFECLENEDSTYAGDTVSCKAAKCAPLCEFSTPKGPCGLPESGPCAFPNGSGGCADASCCCEVCEVEAGCCDLEWDELCALLATTKFGCAPEPGNPTDLATGDDPEEDGYLLINTDDFGSYGVNFAGGVGNGDTFNPVGAEGPGGPTFIQAFSVYRQAAGESIILSKHSGLEVVCPDTGTMIRTITELSEDTDTNADLVNDTKVSTWELTSTSGMDTTWVLTQHVFNDTPKGGPLVAIVTFEFEITNNTPIPADFILHRHLDMDSLFGTNDFADDNVGTGTNGSDADRYVYQGELGMPETHVTLSSPTGDVYYGGKQNVNPDPKNKDCPTYGFGTDVQICANPEGPGTPACWENNIAGVGYDTDGDSGPDANGKGGGDGFIGMEIPVTVPANGVTTVSVMLTYGAKTPGGIPGGEPQDCTRVIAKLDRGISKLGRAIAKLTSITDDTPPATRVIIVNDVIGQIKDTIAQLEEAIAQLEAIQNAGGEGCPDGIDFDRIIAKLDRAIRKLQRAIDKLIPLLDRNFPPDEVVAVVNDVIDQLRGTIKQLEDAINQLKGFPDCPWDLDNSGSVGATDLLTLLVAWGPCDDCNDCKPDFDGNCSVGATDLLALLVNWGPCP